jgi:hypothetical protein
VITIGIQESLLFWQPEAEACETRVVVSDRIGSQSTEKVRNTASIDSSDNLQPAYRRALQLAHTRARSYLRLTSL